MYESLKTYVEMYAPSELLTAVLIDALEADRDDVRALLQAHGARMEPRDWSLVEYEVGRGVDEPAHFLVQARWRTADAAAANLADFGRDLDVRLAALGAEVRRFDGRARARTALS